MCVCVFGAEPSFKIRIASARDLWMEMNFDRNFMWLSIKVKIMTMMNSNSNGNDLMKFSFRN